MVSNDTVYLHPESFLKIPPFFKL